LEKRAKTTRPSLKAKFVPARNSTGVGTVENARGGDGTNAGFSRRERSGAMQKVWSQDTRRKRLGVAGIGAQEVVAVGGVI